MEKRGYQSDERFTEAFVRVHIDRGQGPIRICQELRRCGIGGELIDRNLDPGEAEWARRIKAVRDKKFGSSEPDSLKERARQTRFLQYRGFSAEQIRSLLGEF